MLSLNQTAEGSTGGGGGGGPTTSVAQPAGFYSSSAAEQQSQQQQQQQVVPPATAAASTAGVEAAAMVAAVAGLGEDPNKKIRKPYTITKSRESWTEQEHDKFLEALQLFDRDWKKIEAFVGSKTVIQCTLSADKKPCTEIFSQGSEKWYKRTCTASRPKRKAAHPYPQKASKNAPLLSQATAPVQAASCQLEPGYTLRADSSSVLRNSNASATMSSWPPNSVPHVSGSHVTKEDVGPSGGVVVNNCVSSSESSPRTWPTCETTEQGNHVPSFRVMPDFAQVYSFIGSVFDPSTSGHLQKLKEMDPIDAETVLLLMRNLSINLTSPDFEDHRRLLSSYDGGTEDVKCAGAASMIHANQTLNPPFMVKGE